MPFHDRAEAGSRLAERLSYLNGEPLVILGLPRGGVPVAFEVARALGAPLDVIIVRKLGVPFQSELGMGAIGEGGVRIVNWEVVNAARVSETELAAVEEKERAELERRARRFRGERPPVALKGKTAVVVDDGIATGFTARAACQVARAQGAERVVLAVPVAPTGSLEELADSADEVVCLETPAFFWAIGQFYDDFAQTTDQEVVTLLEAAAQGQGAKPAMAGSSKEVSDPPVRDEEVEVLAGANRLAGRLTVPVGVQGLVVFAHGSGSSRHSPRNRFVAGVLNEAGFGTLLFDLLTVSEEFDRSNVFDVELLAERLREVTRWLKTQPEAENQRVGYFGASTGSAAALWAAAELDGEISAVVSRGGRPDLAAARLAEVRSPTLLIVGGLDDLVLQLNREAQARLECENELAVVPGATHLFEEPGTLESAAHLARDWFVRYLARKPSPLP
jgi:putative phosphoribosyl transferase